MQAMLTVPKTAAVGVPITMSDAVSETSGAEVAYGVTHFALGDGTVHDGTANETFQHAYMYPGTYGVVFEYRMNPYYGPWDITAKATITVTASSVVFSRVDPDGAIELTNSGKTDADVSGWVIDDAKLNASFTIPEATSILSGKTVIFPESLTKIPSDASGLALILPSGTVTATYSVPESAAASAAPTLTTVTSGGSVPEMKEQPTPPTAKKKQPAKTASTKAASATKTSATIALSANALAAEDPDDADPTQGQPQKHSAMPLIIGIAGIIAVGGLLFWKLKIPKEETESIHIVEE